MAEMLWGLNQIENMAFYSKALCSKVFAKFKFMLFIHTIFEGFLPQKPDKIFIQ